MRINLKGGSVQKPWLQIMVVKMDNVTRGTSVLRRNQAPLPVVELDEKYLSVGVPRQSCMVGNKIQLDIWYRHEDKDQVKDMTFQALGKITEVQDIEPENNTEKQSTISEGEKIIMELFQVDKKIWNELKQLMQAKQTHVQNLFQRIRE